MSVTDIQKHTAEFFRRHWPSMEERPAPVWSARWDFIGTIPNCDRVGCYALFSDDELIYVGVSEDTIARRTSDYTRMAPGGRSSDVTIRPYEPTLHWKSRGMNGIHAIGLPDEYFYLAPALESYLIACLGEMLRENKNTKRLYHWLQARRP
jgi:hypothetical protein